MLSTNDLSINYDSPDGTVRAVSDVNIDIEHGEIVGVIGESGCGKTSLAEAVLRLLPENGEISDGEVLFDDRNLLEIPTKEFNREYRWKELSYIPQTSLDALDPLESIFVQYKRMQKIANHTKESDQTIRKKAKAALQSVGLDGSRIDDYPHEMSGGMKQRLMIAFAFAMSPSLIVADEPTTALDVVIQDQVLKTLLSLQREYDTAIMFITHDLSVIAEICDKVAVMYAGDLVEFGETEQVFSNPAHPYTMGLKNAIPELENFGEQLISIPGTPPKLTAEFSGCKFRDRCPFATEECSTSIPYHTIPDSHTYKCVNENNMSDFREEAQQADTWVN